MWSVKTDSLAKSMRDIMRYRQQSSKSVSLLMYYLGMYVLVVFLLRDVYFFFANLVTYSVPFFFPSQTVHHFCQGGNNLVVMYKDER